MIRIIAEDRRPKTEDCLLRPQTVSYRSYNYWDRDEPQGWLTALVVVVFLALFLWLTCSAHCAEPSLHLPRVSPSPLPRVPASPRLRVPPSPRRRASAAPRRPAPVHLLGRAPGRLCRRLVAVFPNPVAPLGLGGGAMTAPNLFDCTPLNARLTETACLNNQDRWETERHEPLRPCGTCAAGKEVAARNEVVTLYDPHS